MSAATGNPLAGLKPAEYARCSVCNDAYFPVHTLTPCGHDAEPSIHPFDEPGEVYSWTRSHGADGPVLLAMADFPGGELRVTAPVTGADAVEIGDQLVVLTGEGVPFTLAPTDGRGQ